MFGKERKEWAWNGWMATCSIRPLCIVSTFIKKKKNDIE